MPAVRLLPDNQTLRRWVEEDGLTHQEIADRIEKETGQRVARSTVSAALSRAGLSAKQERYTDEIPWRVEARHLREYPARMLRLLGRRNRGLSLKEEEDLRLTNWLDMLSEQNAVVAYDPTAVEGFVYTERIDTDPTDLPIRKQIVKVG